MRVHEFPGIICRWLRVRTFGSRALAGVATTPDRKHAVIERLRGRERQCGIELSPGAVPIIDKDTFNVVYLDKFDHSSTDSYLNGTPVRIDALLGEKYIDEVLEHDTYAYLFSSHVIEHIPDFIQFFISAANVLADGARLLMYVPDKRYTFDVLRSETTIAQIEEAYRQRLRHPSRDMVMDWYKGVDLSASAVALWKKIYAPQPTHKAIDAERIAQDVILEDEDIHCFTFTPESFRVLIAYVIAEYAPVYRVIEITETPYGQNEFLVDMTVCKSGS